MLACEAHIKVVCKLLLTIIMLLLQSKKVHTDSKEAAAIMQAMAAQQEVSEPSQHSEDSQTESKVVEANKGPRRQV